MLRSILSFGFIIPLKILFSSFCILNLTFPLREGLSLIIFFAIAIASVFTSEAIKLQLYSLTPRIGYMQLAPTPISKHVILSLLVDFNYL